MNVKKLRYRICILVAAILAVACLPVSAAVSVKAQLDSASLLMESDHVAQTYRGPA